MIAIVTDSTACMTKKDAEELGVFYVPINYSIDGVAYKEDFVDQCPELRAKVIGNENLRTSQATTLSFMHTFVELRKKGYQILCITLSSRLSGTYNNAMACANELDKENICVVDSLSVSGGIWLLAKKAREFIDEGFSLKEVAEKINGYTKKVRLVFSVDDMGPIRKSGRLGSVKQSVSTILNVKPILSCEDGRIICKKMVRGTREKINELANFVPSNTKEMMVLDFKSEKEREDLALHIQKKCGNTVLLYRRSCISLGIHTGEGAVGVAWLEK